MVSSLEETRYSVVCTAVPPVSRQSICATTKSAPAARVARDGVHVDVAVADMLRERVVGTQGEPIQVLQPAGPLHRGVGPAGRHRQFPGLVRGDEVTTLGSEERDERLLPDTEAEA